MATEKFSGIARGQEGKVVPTQSSESPDLKLVGDSEEPTEGVVAKSEEAETRQERTVGYLTDLSERKSPLVAKYYAQKMAEILNEGAKSQKVLGAIGSKLAELDQEIERIPDLAEAQERALSVLENLGTIARTGDNLIVANLEKICNIGSSGVRNFGVIFESEFYGARRVTNALYYAFKGLGVISEDDYQRGTKTGKPLFYSPRSTEEAFDIEAIRESDFYLGLWQATGHVLADQEYPSTEDEANFAEVSVACRIYHPDFGDGYRDESGRLWMRDDTIGKYRPISGERLFSGMRGLGTGVNSRPGEYVEKNFPNLNLSGLLEPQDFRTTPAQMTERPVGVMRKVDRNGSVMIDGIQYYIGKQQHFQEARIYQISDHLAALCQDGEITHTFSLRDFDDPELKRQTTLESEAIYKRADKETTGLTAYDPEKFRVIREGETENEQRERNESLDNFQTWLWLNDLTGPEGIQSFREMQLDPETTELLLSIKNEMDEKTIDGVATAYREIVKSVREFGNFIRKHPKNIKINEQIVNRIVCRLMRKSLRLILEYAKEGEEVSPKELQRNIDDLRSEVEIFAATFRETKLEYQAKMEDFEKFQFDVIRGPRIDRQTRENMERILIANRIDRPDIIEQATADFKTALQNPDSTFYVMRYDGQLIGFFRVDRQGELDVYIGSLNVPQKYQGTGIGDEALQKYFDIALNGRIGHASADPRNPITPKYIGRYNFVAEAIKPYGQSGKPYFEMRLDKNLNSGLRFFQAKDEAIVSAYHDNSYNIGQSEIILRFGQNEMDQLIAESEQILATGEYVMSAFRKIDNENDNQNGYYYCVFESKPQQQ